MIAFSTGSLHTYGIARVVHLAAAAGFDGLELMIDDRWDTRDAAHLRAVVESAGIPIVSVHAQGRPGNRGWEEDEVARLHRAVTLAHVHLSTYDGRQHRLPQVGSLALGPFLTALRRRGYEGAIVVELQPDALGAGDEGRVRARLSETVAFCPTHFPGR